MLTKGRSRTFGRGPTGEEVEKERGQPATSARAEPVDESVRSFIEGEVMILERSRGDERGAMAESTSGGKLAATAERRRRRRVTNHAL